MILKLTRKVYYTSTITVRLFKTVKYPEVAKTVAVRAAPRFRSACPCQNKDVLILQIVVLEASTKLTECTQDFESSSSLSSLQTDPYFPTTLVQKQATLVSHLNGYLAPLNLTGQWLALPVEGQALWAQQCPFQKQTKISLYS
jgi:hypothetical protein